jgi:hypothetical protein
MTPEVLGSAHFALHIFCSVISFYFAVKENYALDIKRLPCKPFMIYRRRGLFLDKVSASAFREI